MGSGSRSSPGYGSGSLPANPSGPASPVTLSKPGAGTGAGTSSVAASGSGEPALPSYGGGGAVYVASSSAAPAAAICATGDKSCYANGAEKVKRDMSVGVWGLLAAVVMW